MNFSSVLLVEDELNLASALKLSLKKMAIPNVVHVATIAEARNFFETHKNAVPELVVLDRMLPDGEGLDLCAELRAHDYKGAILVLTANGLVNERVKGLDAGADDYLAKPFSWEELSARLRALSRRNLRTPKLDEKETLWFCDESRVRVFGPKGWVSLTPLEFKLVKKLIDADGAIVTRDVLLTDVWGFKWLPKTRTVDYFMGRLRKHFEIDVDAPKHFLTVRGAGYRFEK